MASTALKNPIVAPEPERKALGKVARALGTERPGRARLVGADGGTMIIPHSLYVVLREAARQLALGNGISIMPTLAALTTQQAADHLNVSRPFLVKLLEQGAIPFHTVGTHRRIYLRDLLAYKERRDARAKRAFGEIIRDAQELGDYDE